MGMSDVLWAEVRAAYEAGDESKNAICARYGVTLADLNTRARRNKWESELRKPVLERDLVIEKLFYAFERLLIHIGEKTLSEDGEKEAAVLHRLTLTMDKLMTIDGRHTGKQPTARQSREMIELRARISKRLDELQVR